jgi:ABC-type sugar transport system substrate-binding protein
MKPGIIAGVISLLLLVACNSSNAPKQPTIGVSFETLQTEYWVAGFEAIKAELKKRDIAMLEAIADGDANRQFEQVNNFIARGVDGIIIAPKDAKTVIPMIKAANAANIPIVLYNRPADKTEAKSVAVVADNPGITKATAE